MYKLQRATYDGESHRRAARVDTAVAAFRRNLRAMIEEPARAPATDLWSALRQADVFLGETREWGGARDTRGTRAPRVRLVIVALTDGIHTVAAAPHALSSAPELFVVNSIGETGALARLHPQRFESLPAMLRVLGATDALRAGVGTAHRGDR